MSGVPFGNLIGVLDSKEIIKIRRLDQKENIFVGTVEALFTDSFDNILENYKNVEVFKLTVSYGRIVIILN